MRGGQAGDLRPGIFLESFRGGDFYLYAIFSDAADGSDGNRISG